MSNRTLVLDASTGRQSYTNHPERLLRRGHAVCEGAALRVIPAGFAARLNDADAEVEFRRNRGGILPWNGAEGHWKSKLPGTASVFRRQGQRPSR